MEGRRPLSAETRTALEEGILGLVYHDTIESLNARYRRTADARGHFPFEQAALEYLYLTIR